MNSFGHVSGTTCSVLFGYLVVADDPDSYNTPLFVIAFMVLVAAFLFPWIDPTRPLVSVEAKPAPVEEPVCVPGRRPPGR